MLSPSHGERIVLLPQDREIISIFGCTEAEYLDYCRHLRSVSRLEPGSGEPVMFWNFVIQLAIGVALSIASALLAPKPRNAQPARLESNQTDGQNIVQSDRFAPKSGFGGGQNVVELGSVVPVVFANREELDGKVYGGVRINANLLWSEVTTIRGGLMLRALYMLGEGPLSAPDPNQIALGENLLNSYQFEAETKNEHGRMTLYFRGDGGQIGSENYLAGRNPRNDEGNATNEGGAYVFATRRVDDNDWTTDFSYASTPTSQTTFGLYQPIGNGLVYRVNPRIEPQESPYFNYRSNGDAEVLCSLSPAPYNKRQKQEDIFNSRANILPNGGLGDGDFETDNVGDTITYTISPDSDAPQYEYQFIDFTGTPPGARYELGVDDVSTTIAGRNSQYDDALVIGELYKIGTALYVLVDRSENRFVSKIDQNPQGTGSAVFARFRCVRAGTHMVTSNYAPPNKNNPPRLGTNTSHIFRVARGSFVTDRPCSIVEIGIRSSVGIRFNNIMDFRTALTYEETDFQACGRADYTKVGAAGVIPSGGRFTANNITSGTFTGAEVRYSFFRVSYRTAGSRDGYTVMSNLFGVRSAAQQAVYNSLRIQMPDTQRWEFLIEPVSGWEIRTNLQFGALEVLDWRMGSRVIQVGDVSVRFNGEQVSRSRETFELVQGTTKNSQSLGPGRLDPMDGNNYIDSWGKLAELFAYEEVTASVGSPEHEIVYVNQVSPNETVPSYFRLGLLGLNLRSSQEITQLSQISAYISKGLGPTHRWPDILRILLLNDSYGVGSVLSEQQVDRESFDKMAARTEAFRWFWDGAITTKLNLLQWASETARRFMLDFTFKNGVYSLKPAFYFDQPEPITGLFTAANIVDDTFSLSYFEPNDRQQVRMSVRWREEEASSVFENRGLFPQVREINVRETSLSNQAPIENIDVSDFCTSEGHAIDIAKYEIRFRRLVTHSVTFKVMPSDALGLDIARCFKLNIAAVAYKEPYNGVVLSDGTIRYWAEDSLADGDYPVMLWRGVGQEIEEVTLHVMHGKAVGIEDAVFTMRSDVSEVTETYKVQSLAFDEDGLVEVTGIHWPTDEAGFSLISKDWDTGWELLR